MNANEQIGTIGKYNDSLYITYKEWGKSFTLDVPHKNHWQALLRFLRKRGFKITENQWFKAKYNCLSKYKKIGVKKNVRVLAEIGANRIELKFGNVKNLWNPMAQSFWDSRTDERHTKLSYNEYKEVDLEIKNAMQFFVERGLTKKVNDSDLNPVEYILHKLNVNKHIHGAVTCLNDIKVSIESGAGQHNGLSNSDDKNKKKIICGDKKYFYHHRTGRLSCGIAWHNINNMWWVLYGNDFTNIACFELFDYSPELPRKLPLSKSKANRILKKLESERKYKSCMGFEKQYRHLLQIEVEK